MEVLLTKIRSQVDKFAKFNVHGDAILYTTKDDAKKQRAIGVQEGNRITSYNVCYTKLLRGNYTDTYRKNPAQDRNQCHIG